MHISPLDETGPQASTASEPLPIPDAETSAALALRCIGFISDALLITEAQPLDAPGPRILYANRAFERMTGYAAAEIVGRSPRMLQGARTDRQELGRIRAALSKWLPVRAELVNYKKNGDEFFVEMDIVPLADEHGRWTHWVAIQRDVTARKKAEAEALVRQAQRYESLGTLSSGIAHDFNNIIAAILGNVSNASADMEAGLMPHASLEQIRKAALRARSVVAKILAYARRRSDAFAPLALTPVVLEATDLLRAIVPAGVAFEVVCPAEPLWVNGDPSQLCQVLMNLGVNALQALDGRVGRIRVELTVSTDLSTAIRTASVEVADTGCGMDAATRARVFEPYFTTKEDGRGTGLGLSVVWGIAAAHGGSVEVASEVGRGSRVTLSLPLVEEVAADASAASPAATPNAFGRGEHVLVVDDDDVVVVMLEGMLQRWGFRVTARQDPLEALALLKDRPDEFRAVVTDLNMPRVSGLELAREVLDLRPALPVLLASGTVTPEIVDAAARIGVHAVFPKEYAVEQLGALLQDALRLGVPPPPASAGETARAADPDVRPHRHATSPRASGAPVT